MVIISSNFYAIARVGDKISGNCHGNYESREIVSHSEDGEPIYGWVTRSESGTFEGEIISGSNILFDGGRAIARVGDKVRIYKKYNHSRHHDDINITATITTGSKILFDQGRAVAYVGCEVSGSGFHGVIATGSSKMFVGR